MNNNKELTRLEIEEAKQRAERKEEIRINLLSQYSTTELKRELRRRKGN